MARLDGSNQGKEREIDDGRMEDSSGFARATISILHSL